MSDNELDSLFKEAAGGFQAPQDPSAWEAMAKKLDQASPVTGSIWNWKSILSTAIVGVTTVALIWYYSGDTQQGISTDPNNNAKTESIAQSDSQKSVEDDLKAVDQNGSSDQMTSSDRQVSVQEKAAVDAHALSRSDNSKSDREKSEVAVSNTEKIKGGAASPNKSSSEVSQANAKLKRHASAETVESDQAIKDENLASSSSQSSGKEKSGESVKENSNQSAIRKNSNNAVLKAGLVASVPAIAKPRASDEAALSMKEKGTASSEASTTTSDKANVTSENGTSPTDKATSTSEKAAAIVAIEKADKSDKAVDDLTSSTTEKAADQSVNKNRNAKGESADVESQDSVKQELIVKKDPIDSAAQKSGDEILPKKKQSRGPVLSVKLAVAPDFSSINFFTPDNPGFNYGGLIGYSFNNRWSVYTGAISSRKIYTSDDIHKSYTNSGGYDYPVEKLDGDCRVLDIPVLVYYTFFPDRSFSLKAGLGFSSYLMLNEDYVYHVDNPYGSDIYYQSIEHKNNEWFKVLNVSMIVEKRLSNKFSLEFEPFLKAPLAGVGEGEVSLVSLGAFLNLRFDIPIHKHGTNDK